MVFIVLYFFICGLIGNFYFLYKFIINTYQNLQKDK